ATVQLLPVAAFRVGTLGKSADGASAITARLFTLPASISERASGSDTGAICTPPATRSCSPGAAPFDGTHGTLAGSTLRSFSMPAMARCQMPPWPVPDAFILPGLALIADRRSFIDLYGASVATCTPAGSALTSASGVNDAPVRSV